jgi:hypothetical protein
MDVLEIVRDMLSRKKNGISPWRQFALYLFCHSRGGGTRQKSRTNVLWALASESPWISSIQNSIDAELEPFERQCCRRETCTHFAILARTRQKAQLSATARVVRRSFGPVLLCQPTAHRQPAGTVGVLPAVTSATIRIGCGQSR